MNRNKIPGYRALHYWVQRNKGSAATCQICGKIKTTPKSIQWANKSGTYLRELDDWVSLCVPCHRQLDMTFNRKRQLIANLGLSFKLEESDIISIYQEAKTGKNYKDIARTYHVDESNIRLILNRKTWKHVEVQL